jgi:hypothetical protein
MGGGRPAVTEGGGSGLISQVILKAAVAGGYEYWARREPKRATAFRAVAAEHRADYTGALDEVEHALVSTPADVPLGPPRLGRS